MKVRRGLTAALPFRSPGKATARNNLMKEAMAKEGKSPQGEGAPSLSIAESSGTRRIKVEGELDMLGSIALRDAIAARTDPEAVVVDTTGLTFIDTHGIHVLVAARRDLQHRFTLIAGDRTRHLLRIMGLTDYFGLDPRP